MEIRSDQRVAVIGAGIAGAACARALSLAGLSVHVYEKSRGPGGRLATRRVEFVDRKGHACTTRLDHGAFAIAARSEAFQTFVDEALHAGWLAEWAPVLAAGSLPPEGGDRLNVPVPEMPSLCRRLLDGAAATWCFAVDGLHRSPLGWEVQAGAERHHLQFDAVVLALPPAQAHWVVHGRAGWSLRHLEQPAAWVQQQMQAALAECLGRPVDWHHCVVHRWRYARPQVHGTAPAEACWWDAAQGLGVCGDFLGGSGVEGAWLSARALCTALLQRACDTTDVSAAFADDGSAHPAVRHLGV